MQSLGVAIVLVTTLLLATQSDGKSLKNEAREYICNFFCDGSDSSSATDTRIPVQAEVFSRKIELIISDRQNMGYARISNGDPSDAVWIQRSFDGGISWENNDHLGDSVIQVGAKEASTQLYNVDDPFNPANNFRLGALRACGKAGDREEVVCTGWARSKVLAETRIDAAATALMQFYNEGGLWTSTGWWNAANCLTTIIDYIRLSGHTQYTYAIERTFEKNVGAQDGNFTNMYVDDVGWWGLAWVDAYDLTGNQKYLDMAKFDADFMYATKDDHCGGGVWWTTIKDYKNAIPNELFIKLAAALHNRIPGDTKYLGQATEVYEWFRNSGMYNSDNLINDGLTDDCKNNGGETWTYNQGVILGGLVQLEKGTGDAQYLEAAKLIADATLASAHLNPDNILREPCELDEGECGGDGTSFKGIFIRNLGELNRALADRPYSAYLKHLADTIYEKDRNSLDQYGVHFAGPFTIANAANQHGALDVFTAAIEN